MQPRCHRIPLPRVPEELRDRRWEQRGGTQCARLVTGTWWHLKVTGKGKETGTWPLPWLPPSIHQRWLQAHVTPVFNHRSGF